MDYSEVARPNYGPRGTPAPQSVQAQLQELGEKTFFIRGVVVETLNNLALRDDDQLKKLLSPAAEGLPAELAGAKGNETKTPDILNPRALEDAPRDSLIVRLTGARRDGSPGKVGREAVQTMVCYPFFSSHLSLPIKVGEQVWVFFEAGITDETTDAEIDDLEAWWLTRIVGPLITEDLNYSHYDRRYDLTNKDDAEGQKFYDPKEDVDREQTPPAVAYDIVPSFFNGEYQESEPGAFTFRYQTEYQDYFDAWGAKDDFVIEPVPRYTKRPGDLVLQGSHNSSIVLGSDRGYKHDVMPDLATKSGDGKVASNAHRSADEGPLKEGLGAIDIVAGRGRLHGPPADFVDADPEVGTEPLVVKNSRETHETNKNPGVKESQKVDEPFGHFNNRKYYTEGDPHFVNDASRIYLTMKSSPDDQFALITKNIPTVISSEKLEDKTDISAVVLKSDEVRIVARKHGLDSQKEAEAKTTSEANGSIRIIKEGAVDDDACCIYLLPDGTIQISGKRIDFGREDATDGGKADGATANDGLTPALGEHKNREPYMRYSDFSVWADALIGKVVASFDKTAAKIAANATDMNTCASAGASGGVGGIIPLPNFPLGAAIGGMAAAAARVALAGTDLGTGDIEALDSESEDMKKIRSERIYGE
jgi:hypothetical protein